MKTSKQPVMNRRSLMKAAAVAGASLLPASASRGQVLGISAGDAAILRFLAAAETLETDAWQQYKELSNGNPVYMAALKAIDDDMPSYVAQNTADEVSHAAFLNAYNDADNAHRNA